ncbi:hypothetical protein OIU79_000759 [Salix purpurea]|uniref:Uncharacterized protein n=1 Tax=Salix purpurea TaxID=77065 RepID=A0A9Q0V2X8_SALPP|nr:hypothetical protein OIU79_000759 [Salix purpurea]
MDTLFIIISLQMDWLVHLAIIWQMSKAICYLVVRGQPRRLSSRLHELEVFLICCCCKFNLLCITTHLVLSLFFSIKFTFSSIWDWLGVYMP